MTNLWPRLIRSRRTKAAARACGCRCPSARPLPCCRSTTVRRSGAGLFLRRHRRRHHHRAVPAALVLRDRSQFLLHLQGQCGAHEADRRGAGRRLRGRGQRAQGGRARAHHSTAQRGDDGQPALGGALRPRSRRRVRHPGRDHRGDRRRDRAANLCRGKFPRPAQAAGESGCLGPGHARAVALLAHHPAGQSPRRHCSSGRSPSIPTMARRWGCSPSVTCSASAWAGRTSGRAGRRARRPGGDARRQRGSVGAPGARQHPSVRRRFDDSLAEFERRCGSMRTSRWPRAVTAWRWPCGRWQEADEAARRALRLSPRDPFSALFYGVAAYAQFVGRNYEEAMQLAREAIRLRRDFIGGPRCSPPPPAWPDRPRSQRPRCRSCAGPSPTFPWPGSQSRMPIKHEADREHYLEGFRRAGLE